MTTPRPFIGPPYSKLPSINPFKTSSLTLLSYSPHELARARGPVPEWDTHSPAVRPARLGGEVRRADVLAVEHVSMDVPEKSSDDATLRAVVLMVRYGKGRVAHRELVSDIANGRFVAEDLCRCLGVGLHVVRPTHAPQW